jgi:hypothetical protein
VNRPVVTLSFIVAIVCSVGVRAGYARDTAIQEQLCTRLLQSADSPGTYRAASNTCIQASVGHKERADRVVGSQRQHELLFEAAFMVMAAQAESHGGDAAIRSQLLSKAKDLAVSVRARPLSASVKADAARLLRDIQQLQ